MLSGYTSPGRRQGLGGILGLAYRGEKAEGTQVAGAAIIYLIIHSFILYYCCPHQYAVPFLEASGCMSWGCRSLPSTPPDRASPRELASSLLPASLGSSSCLV